MLSRANCMVTAGVNELLEPKFRLKHIPIKVLRVKFDADNIKFETEGTMAALLLTPLMLATAPVTLELPASQYNHASQTQQGFHLAQYNTGYCFTTSTFNGTATYDYNGKPYDNDSDSDTSGDC